MQNQSAGEEPGEPVQARTVNDDVKERGDNEDDCDRIPQRRLSKPQDRKAQSADGQHTVTEKKKAWKRNRDEHRREQQRTAVLQDHHRRFAKISATRSYTFSGIASFDKLLKGIVLPRADEAVT